MDKETVEAILARLRSNAKCCPNSTTIDRARKGAYVDSIVIIEQMARQSKPIEVSDSDIEKSAVAYVKKHVQSIPLGMDADVKNDWTDGAKWMRSKLTGGTHE